MNFKNLLLASVLLFTSGSSFAGLITWNIVTNYNDLKGTITFDDTAIKGLTDGAYDSNDTHIYNATVTLLSSLLNINQTFTNVMFQPLTNTFDNKHIDSSFTVTSKIGTTRFDFSSGSNQGNPAKGISEYWLYVDNINSHRWAFVDNAGVNNNTNLKPVPAPVPLSLLAICLVGLGLARRFAQAK